MDAIDRKIVALLQEDASLSLAQIAHRVGLSQSPCWKRIQRLEKSGVILKRVALISPESIGMGLSVFVSRAACLSELCSGHSVRRAHNWGRFRNWNVVGLGR